MAALHHLIGSAGGHKLHHLASADTALHQAHIDNNTPVAVILAVEDQRLQGGVHIAGGRGNVLDDILQNRFDIDAHLGGDLRCVHGGKADDVLHLVLGLLRVRGRKVDLIEHGQNLQLVLHGQVGVSQGLGLHALGGIHHQYGALAGGNGTGDLVVEVHVARGVDEVQVIGFTVLGTVLQAHGPGLDGDAPFLFQIHVVQELAFHLPLADSLAHLQKPVRQGGLAVVDMGDDGKIADIGLFNHIWKTS